MKSKKQELVHRSLLVILVLIFFAVGSQAAEKFYVIAHMVNDARTAGWALRSGANAVEVDLQFNTRTGQPTRFHHGTPCDCTCIDILPWMQIGSVCKFNKACRGGTSYGKHLQFLKNHRNLALIYIDSKNDKLSAHAQRQAGPKVVKAMEDELFKRGYGGKVLIGGGKQKVYTRAVADAVRLSHWKSRIYVSLDFTDNAVDALTFMSRLPTRNVIYSTGISACSPKSYLKQIRLASFNKDRGVVGNVFIWTLDKTTSFNAYYHAGARGIMTNRVPGLVKWARRKGLQLATPLDNSLPPATSTNVLRSIVCDCNYKPGGCRISRVAPPGTACKCRYVGFWTCKGRVVRCHNRNAYHCRRPDNSIQSCFQGRGDCEGYKSHRCDCNYKPGGCRISKPSPRDTACRCNYKGFWTCSGTVVRCRDPNSSNCKHPSNSHLACIQGGGDCGGYKNAKCDCNYKGKRWRKSGCKISKAAPKYTACKCTYKGAWTCGGTIVRCRNPNSWYCKHPGYGIHSCRLGGGDCWGY